MLVLNIESWGFLGQNIEISNHNQYLGSFKINWEPSDIHILNLAKRSQSKFMNFGSFLYASFTSLKYHKQDLYYSTFVL